MRWPKLGMKAAPCAPSTPPSRRRNEMKREHILRPILEGNRASVMLAAE